MKMNDNRIIYVIKEKVRTCDMEKTIEEVINEETEKRLAEMQSPDYVFPKKMDSHDFIAILASMGICALLMALCMMGVIR